MLNEREFFKDRFTVDQLRQILGDRKPSEIFNWKSVSARKMGLAAQREKLSGDEDGLLQLMVEEPNLIKRPLIVVGGELVAGFDRASKPRLTELLGRNF
ncbi:MAG: hypothetical protein EXR58_06720 [Chloroflexi bacterium]|nr:hypothetical protein [Chloroflexota bacterium]